MIIQVILFASWTQSRQHGLCGTSKTLDRSHIFVDFLLVMLIALNWLNVADKQKTRHCSAVAEV